MKKSIIRFAIYAPLSDNERRSVAAMVNALHLVGAERWPSNDEIDAYIRISIRRERGIGVGKPLKGLEADVPKCRDIALALVRTFSPDPAAQCVYVDTTIGTVYIDWRIPQELTVTAHPLAGCAANVSEVGKEE